MDAAYCALIYRIQDIEGSSHEVFIEYNRLLRAIFCSNAKKTCGENPIEY
jgi:hypothetical protein